MKKLKIGKNANKGITLIALVITIIVLLILAAVSIATLTGENGILTQAGNSKTQTAIGEEKEAIGLAYNGAIVENIGESVTAGDLNTQFTKNGVNATASGTGTITVKFPDTSRSYTIDSNGNITGPTTSDEQTGKWAEPYDIAGFTHIKGEWDTGYVIQDNTTGSEFVWIPVGGTINGTTINLERTFYDENLMTDEWAQNVTGSPDIEQFLQQFGVNTKADYWKLFSENEDNLAEFKTSVEENGGFYIGRYEASYQNGKAVTKESTDISRNSSSATLTNGMLWNYISQTDAITESEKMYEGNPEIKSKLVNSYAWDTALKFIEVVEGKNVDTDSSEWGNYNSSLANTGATSKAVACNIYDLAGNIFEWTTENIKIGEGTEDETSIAVIRGGGYGGDGADFPAGYRNGADPSITIDYIGFRPLLYK